MPTMEEFANYEHGRLLESLIYLNRPKVILEIGVAEAHATQWLCSGAKAVGGKVFGYDSWTVHGLMKQFNSAGNQQSCTAWLNSKGYDDSVFELTTIDSQSSEFAGLIKTKHPVIDFAFIDGCHSYIGAKTDFDNVYPLLSPGGIIVFHDTLRIDGCRELMIDLRTTLNDGTYDIIDFPWGNADRRVGVSMLVKRTYPVLGLGIDEQCNLDNHYDDIYKKEQDWYQSELKRYSK
jgi:hypothetical protein